MTLDNSRKRAELVKKEAIPVKCLQSNLFPKSFKIYVLFVCILQNVYANYLNFHNERVKKLGLNPMTCSFNVGVFVANVSLWKEQKITAKLDYWLALNAK